MAGKEFSLGIELWAQVGESDGGSLQDISGVETSFYLSGALSDNWDLSLAWYNFDYYDSAEDEYDYQTGTEDYLTYSLPLATDLTFAVESYVEAYYTPDSGKESLTAHIEPMVKYNKKVNDSISWHAAVSYEVVNFDYSNSDADSHSSSWSNNEMEMVLGFTIR